jgi:hypothetical protein
MDRTVAALEAAGPGELGRVQTEQQASWQTMFEFLLEGLDGQEQRRAADELRGLLAGFADGQAIAVGPGAVAVAGDVGIHAEAGGAAAWHMDNVQIGYPADGPAGPGGESAGPQQPGRSRG